MTDSRDRRDYRRDRRSGWSGVGLVAIGLLLAWWFVAYPDFTGRYKLSVTVEGDGRTWTDAIVYDVTYVWDPHILPEQASIRQRVTGEALFIELGGGRNLIITLTASGSGRPSSPGGARIKPGQISGLSTPLSAAELPTFAFALRLATWKTFWDIHTAWKTGKVEVPPAGLPTTVTFTDPADPKAVTLVDPTDLEATFGPGYRITRATIEVTDEPLTRGIEEKLPWLNALEQGNLTLGGKRYPKLGDGISALYTYVFRSNGFYP